MSKIKIGSAYFEPDRIKGYHFRLKKYADGEIWWEVRADTMVMYRCKEYLKAHAYLHEVIEKIQSLEREAGNANQEPAG